jgi:hypothetical protein
MKPFRGWLPLVSAGCVTRYVISASARALGLSDIALDNDVEPVSAFPFALCRASPLVALRRT